MTHNPDACAVRNCSLPVLPAPAVKPVRRARKGENK